VFRDIVMVQFGRDTDLVNREYEAKIRTIAADWTPERTLTVLDRIAETRRNLEQNVAPLLAVESMLITVATGATP
jgi:DNA polymerase-3 subunit delta'